MVGTMEKGFDMPREEFMPETRFLEDLKPTSVQFFPIMAALENEFDIEVQYQDFRRNRKTLKDAIDFIEKLAGCSCRWAGLCGVRNSPKVSPGQWPRFPLV
jgi:acyl carrier protein